MKRIVALAFSAVLLSACGGLESGLKSAMNDDLANSPLCLNLGAPPYIANGVTDWRYGLVGNGMFSSMPRYGGDFELIPTKKAEKKIKDGKLCYGRTEFVKLIDHTKPVDTAQGRIVRVEARVRHIVTEEWAKGNELLQPHLRTGEQDIARVFVEKKSGWSPR